LVQIVQAVQPLRSVQAVIDAVAPSQLFKHSRVNLRVAFADINPSSSREVSLNFFHHFLARNLFVF
jgi:hypothetical protein